MSEITYYADSTVRVTNEWVRLGEKIYPMSEIKSVKVKCAQPDSMKELPYFLMIIGSITTFTLLNVQHLFPDLWANTLPGILTMGVLIGIAGLVLLGAQMVFKPECIYAIRLQGTFGSASPLATDDEQYVNKVVGAIKTALSALASASENAQPMLDSSEQLMPAAVQVDMQS